MDGHCRFRFFESEKWYCERDIPYQIGYLLYGPPGTGKTSFIKTISNFTKRHIHYLNLSQVSDDTQLVELLKDIKYDSTILVIEDIDCVTDILHDRNKPIQNNTTNETIATTQAIMDVIKTVSQQDTNKRTIENKLTLSGILNALDGVFNFHGRILIMTSNKPEILDKAFIRPGRVDYSEHFSNCNTYQLTGLYKCFYDNIDQSIKNKINSIQCNRYSPAHVINVFLKNRTTPNLAIEELINN
jgi:ATP-dependent 26S proteasome regulatory subunit